MCARASTGATSHRLLTTAVLAALAACGVAGQLGLDRQAFAESAASPATTPSTSPATRPVEPKPLSEHVKRGLSWLADHQHPSGGWGQGEESAHMRGGQQLSNGEADPHVETPNVADTCAAALALLRSGSTPADGPYAKHLQRAAAYLCDQVEKSDSTSLFITDQRGTRLQGKLGTYIDTFMAGLTLAEMKDHMPDDASRQRVVAALDETMDKIEKNQQKDGGWANEGWAPALAQGVASKAVNVAAQKGADVDKDVRKNAERYALGNFDASTGTVAGAGGAGVELYTRSSNLQSLKDADATNQIREREIAAALAAPATAPADRDRLERELGEIKETRQQLAVATDAVVGRLEDQQFVAGFGSNGGEEFLSYMNIGETLVAKGGEEWAKWDKSMTENLNRIQNDDGSWSGHHCVTGKTFCTSTALMTLMTDRMTHTVSDQMKRR